MKQVSTPGPWRSRLTGSRALPALQFESFSPRLKRVFLNANHISTGGPRLTSAAMLAALANEPGGVAGVALAEHRVDYFSVATGAKAVESDHAQGDQQPVLSPVMHRVLRNAVTLHSRSGSEFTTTGHALQALLEEEDSIAFGILQVLGVDIRALRMSVRTLTSTGVSDAWVEQAREFVASSSVELASAPPVVWPLILLPANAHLFDKTLRGVSQVEFVNGVARPQMTYDGGRTATLKIAIEEYERQFRVVSHELASPDAWVTTYTLSPTTTGCTLSVEYRLRQARPLRYGESALLTELSQRIRRELTLVHEILQSGWMPTAAERQAE